MKPRLSWFTLNISKQTIRDLEDWWVIMYLKCNNLEPWVWICAEFQWRRGTVGSQQDSESLTSLKIFYLLKLQADSNAKFTSIADAMKDKILTQDWPPTQTWINMSEFSLLKVPFRGKLVEDLSKKIKCQIMSTYLNINYQIQLCTTKTTTTTAT